MPDAPNTLYFGNNLEILRRYIPDESVDLIYLDPPFNSKATYNVLFHERDGTDSAAQITAFDDFWIWDKQAEETFRELVTSGPRSVAELVEALQQFLGRNDMMAYLTMMAVRLVELHRVLKPTGSLYLHCDPTASHYLKQVLDGVFGVGCFRNEIVWQRVAPKGHAYTRFASAHDVILAYGKGDHVTWNASFQAYRQEYTDSHYARVEPETGRRYQLDNCLNPNPDRPNLTYEWRGITRVWRWTRERMQRLDEEGRLVYTKSGMPRYKRYLDEMPGTPVTDVWTDIPPINSQAQERLGYPTQKPEALLERIILASSNEGDLVLDPFCGCGTAVAAAEKWHRRWIGIDITHLAITLIKHRLLTAFEHDLSPYSVVGEPQDLASAEALFREDPFQFQYWALGLVGARPAGEPKRGADKGIDGVLPFFDDDSGKSKRVILQVKGGHVSAPVVQQLAGTLGPNKGEIGALITLQAPTKPMREEAFAAGYYEPPGLQAPVPRLQILTIEGLLNGTERLECPGGAAAAAFKRAPRQHKQKRRGTGQGGGG